MSIITSLPVILQNGTTADASQVMANFNAIVNAVNANAAAAGVNSDITNLTALTVALTVNQGGTGQQALTANCVLIGEGAAGVNAVGPGTIGQALLSNGPGSDPSFQTVVSVPIGGCIMWPTSTPPSGFIEANGQVTTGFPNLIALYGANVPDMRGEFPRGWDNGRGVDPARAILSTQADAIASHSVTITIIDPGHQHDSNNQPGDPSSATALEVRSRPGSGILTSVNTTGITATGAYAGATETRPKNVAWMFIIKT